MTRWSGTAAAAVLVASALAGCGEDAPEPAPLDTAARTSDSSEATPKPDTAPALPDAAKGRSKQSAVAFVEHAIDVLNYGVRDLEPAAITRIGATDCTACESIASLVRRIRSGGGSIEGGAWHPVEALVLDTRTGEDRQVQVLIEADRQTVIDSPGAEPTVHPAGQGIYRFSIRPKAHTWVLTDIRDVS